MHAFVTLVFKGGDPSDVSSYRPILLTCVTSKIMDCSIVTDILAHLCVHNVIDRRQLDFLSGHSTSMNLLESLNNWTLAIKDGKSVLVAYIDYSKTFDSVNHCKLLTKLSTYSISGNLDGFQTL